MKTVNILGTEYEIVPVKISECNTLKNNGWCGSCNHVTKKILIGDPTEENYFGVMSESEQDITTKRTLRHEIIHAFLSESGLISDSFKPDRAWSENEEMVDWIAIQFPKILKVYEEVGAL